jgi:hypothetical protein
MNDKIHIPKKGQDYVDYELVGGGPRDGQTGHMYNPAPAIKFRVQNIKDPEVFIVSHIAPPEPQAVYHTYKLVRGNTTKLIYQYEGFTLGE